MSGILVIACSVHGESIWGGFFTCARCHTVVHESRIEGGQDYCSGCSCQLIDGMPHEDATGSARVCCTRCADTVMGGNVLTPVAEA